MTTMRGPRNWLNQFGEEYQVPVEITTEFHDISWCNDSAPSFTHENGVENDWGGWRLVVEHPDAGKREFGRDCKRFLVLFDRLDEGKSETMLETDDAAGVVKYFKAVDGLQVVVGDSVLIDGKSVFVSGATPKQLVSLCDGRVEAVQLNEAGDGWRVTGVLAPGRPKMEVMAAIAAKQDDETKVDPAFDGGAEQCLTRALGLANDVNIPTSQRLSRVAFEVGQALRCVMEAKESITEKLNEIGALPRAQEAFRLLG